MKEVLGDVERWQEVGSRVAPVASPASPGSAPRQFASNLSYGGFCRPKAIWNVT